VKAVILVGGEGTRLRPLTYSTPKTMVPILNRPFLEHMLKYMKSHNIDDVVLALCYLPDHIRDYFGDGSGHGVKLTYAVESSPLGTAGAVKNVAQHLDETFFVFNGDVFTDMNLTAMLETHRKKSAKATIALTSVDDPTMYGVVETDTNGRIKRFVEKPKHEAVTTNMINAGTYILDPDLLQYIPANQSYMFETGLFPLLLKRGDPFYSFTSHGYWIDIGTPEKYMQVNADLLAGAIAADFPGSAHSKNVWVEEGCKIHPKANIEGPVVIGRSCIIEAQAHIKGPSVIGPDCSIGTGSLVEKSIIWHNVKIGKGAKLQQCIIADAVSIGEGCDIAAGCIIGNKVSIEQNTRLAPDIKVMPGEEISASQNTNC
jgi:mannose-1-phosphate guanylyltransferase